MSKALYPLVAIVGPTASGKSALGIHLAGQFDGEVLACDSTQVYRGFDVGTGKVLPAEHRGIPHHLLDLLEPQEVFTAGEYRRRALDVLEGVRQRGKLPILTAGTGLYLRALLEGLSDAPTRSEELRERLRQRAVKKGPGWLHRILHRLDAERAAQVSAADTPKLIRAIEVCLLAGRPASEVYRAGRPRLEGFAPIKVGLMPARTALYERIEQRVRAMLDASWTGEVQRLLAAGIPETAKPWQFIGYAELRAHLRGVVSLKEAIKTIQRKTRHYAKRQITWFRKEPGVEWFHGFGNDPEITEAVAAFLRQRLSTGRSASASGNHP